MSLKVLLCTMYNLNAVLNEQSYTFLIILKKFTHALYYFKLFLVKMIDYFTSSLE